MALIKLFRLSTFLAVIDTLHAGVVGRQCATTLSNATLVANQLQLHYYNHSTGRYNNGRLWTDASSLEDLHNLMLATDSSYIGKAALDPYTDWMKFLNGSYDDAQWVILALWKIADYKTARSRDGSAYISSATKIYDMVAGQWDDTCGGGVWSSTNHTYKNAITNEQFLLTSAAGYLRANNETYLENAEKEWTWLSASGMRGSSGLFNDGLKLGSCQNNGQTTWTYNQAVVASGLGALYAATRNTSLLDQAEVSLDATISSLAYKGILRESCDLTTSGGKTCDHDQQIFKGIWTKHLQYYLDNVDDTSRITKYSDFLGSQHSYVVKYAMNPAYDVGSVWYAPNEGGSQWSPAASASGLEALISAGKVRQYVYTR
ncbi:hypothetical protein AZE42_07405 [Rhizopogon vesiculosus]|uniref:Glycoside hydrolase family 76 protein n=1 Tax=Rhizopogon vesiculosus TaxID=180088 RepID=A0A1J8QX00_9AGAM|nr:hypothetical protein AZE42_07405 [Rhizopogon vesiculosus]